MKIEVGKYYRTRDGQKVGPIRVSPYGGVEVKKLDAYGSRCFYSDDGFSDLGGDDDIISEWTEEPAAPPETGTLRELNVQPGDLVKFVARGDRDGWDYPSVGDKLVIKEDGSWFGVGADYIHELTGVFRIVSRATPPSQVITERVTTQRIVPGQYGVLAIAGACSDCVELEFTGEYGPTGRSRLTREELTQAIATLTQIRDALK